MITNALRKALTEGPLRGKLRLLCYRHDGVYTGKLDTEIVYSVGEISFKGTATKKIEAQTFHLVGGKSRELMISTTYPVTITLMPGETVSFPVMVA